MSFLKRLVGGDVVDGIKAVGDGLDKVFTSDHERLTHAEIMERIKQQPAAMQVEINKIEAGHRSVFVAGWRPYIGWVAGTSLAIYFIPQYALASIMWVKVSWAAQEIAEYPVSPDAIMELVLAMLGMATLRTYEKVKGAAK
jgi:hypothetical protein